MSSTNQVSPASSAPAVSAATPGTRAWQRYFARIVDMNLSLLIIVIPIILLIIFGLAMISQSLLHDFSAWLEGLSKINTLANIILTCLLWIPIEALLMATLGTTPGKWVFGIKVRDASGNKLRLGPAFNRAGSVCLQGLGLGLPLVSLITLIRAYNRLTRTSMTLWDERLGTEVTYAKFGVIRALGAVLVTLLTVGLIVYNVAG